MTTQSNSEAGAIGDIAAGRASAAELACQFGDVAPLLNAQEAAVAASRCHYCYDAPCIQACPTGIDIPGFIRKIGNGNLKGAAVDILSANPLGGMCARVCPTEVLCEGACVRNHQDREPVTIGALQRHATDWAMASNAQLFTRGPETGRHVAVVGAGPAGLACAHRLAVAGHRVTIFDAHDKAGGLNEYGIAAYKTVDDFAQREVDWLLSVGGIELRTGVALGRDVSLDALRQQHDAVFLAVGLAGVKALQSEGEQLDGVMNAVDFIARLRQSDDLSTLPVGRRVVVIGGGNTAVDAAVQSRKLGAQSVTMVYRRGVDAMSATWAEREFAQTQGVALVLYAQPLRVLGSGGVATGVEFERTREETSADGQMKRLVGTGERFVIEADMVLKAIGQTLVASGFDAELLTTDGSRIAVNGGRRTSLPDVWAGGDCAATGLDLTVEAVQDGKLAAASIDAMLAGGAAKAA
ncbi:NAD(P)-dependent oxidoreductase [Paraburkholderia phosphatilytica]|uniref:NAD(P)-dependent oxidoreductase n=1 Tax=Paraburkholderia phosphatilytica TaxID=2282883 RepID=UPI000E4FED6F|nr:NAD(P)-dependent oxidoreductase [Paraburkholderia phosphatilytica]